MMQWNALTHTCLTITLQHYIKRGLRRWWQAEGSNWGKWRSWRESLWLLQPVFTGTSVCPTGKLSEPRMILDYHTCPCPRLHFSILMWLKGCNHSSQSRNPYCYLWIMSCWTRSKARHQGMYSKCTKKLKLLQNADDCQLNRLFYWELPVLAKLQWVAIAFLGECEMFVWFDRALSETCVTERYLPPTQILQCHSQQRNFCWCSASTGGRVLLAGQPPEKSLNLGIFFSFWSWNIFVVHI